MIGRRKLLASVGATVISGPPAEAWTHGDGRLSLNSRIVYIGDSITAEGSWSGYADLANLIGGARYYTPNGFNLGVSGNTSAQILARMSSALALSPALLVIEAGTNDPFNDLSVTGPNLTAMYQQCAAAGVRVVAVTRFPDVTNTEPAAVNNFIRSYPGITAANCTPGFVNSTMTYDGTHLNIVGGPFVGNIVANAIQSQINTASIFSVTTGQLSSNPTMSGSITPPAVGGKVAGTGVIPTGFRLYENSAAFTVSVVGTQDVAANGANEQIITIVNGAGGTADVKFELPSITINGLAGDLFESWFEADVVQSSGFIALQPFFASSSLFLGQTTTAPDTLQVLNGVYRTVPGAFAGATTATWQLTFQLAASGSCRVKIHNLMTRKVPAGQ